MSFTPGEQVGVYRIMEQLGQGGMATVYKAYHPSLDRYVALKVLHPAFMEDKSFHARFEREARLVARLEHPNIVPIYDYAEHEGRPYLVMKYIEGQTLKARMSAAPLTTQDILQVVEAVGAGLAYAHKQGILHRDIKPSNVILATDGQIYLADFGLARIAQSGDSTLTTDMVMGTPQYISPEQAMGNKKLDEGTDIYSFGVMLYEMTVGRVPFSADTPFSIIHDHIYTPLPLPSVVKPGISADLERVLLKSLAKNREDRFKDVPEMVASFKETWTYVTQAADTVMVPSPDAPSLPLPSDSPIQPPPAPAPSVETPLLPEQRVTGEYEPKKPRGRKKVKWFLLGLFIFLCLCCIVFFALARGSENINSTVQETVAAIIQTSVPPDVAPTVQMAIETAMPASHEVELARMAVDAAPEDPYAHYALATAYDNSGLPRLGAEEFIKALELGSDDEEFLADTADELVQNMYWVPAAMTLARLSQNFPESMTPEYRDMLHEAVYNAAGQSQNRFGLDLPVDQLQKMDGALDGIIKVKAMINNGNLVVAGKTLDRLEAQNDNIPEYALLRAEIAIANGDNAEATRMLEELASKESNPEWVIEAAMNLLGELQ